MIGLLHRLIALPARAVPVVSAYRLRRWPALAAPYRTARMYQALTRMEVGPVTLAWFALRAGLTRAEARKLFRELMQCGCVERIPLHSAASRAEAPTVAAALLDE